jgi:hypothetical protein
MRWLEMSIETWLLIVLPVSAVVIVALGYIIAKVMLDNAKLLGFMGTGSWKVTESWASTLTASGAVLGLILAAQVLPEQPQTFSRNTYVMLNLMFGVVIVAATLFYNAIRLPRRVATVEKGQTTTTTENQGLVLIFLIASAMVLWALFGQLVTTWYLLGEIAALPSYVYGIFRNVIRISAVLAVVYGIGSVPWTLYNQANRKDKDWILL